MRLSFDIKSLVWPTLPTQETPENEDRFESATYVQQTLNFLSKTISGVNHYLLLNRARLALGTDLPEVYRQIFYEVDPDESALLDQFLDQLSVGQNFVEAAESMTQTCTELMALGSPRMEGLLDLAKNLFLNKYLINTQFATDSLGILLEFGNAKIDRYYDSTIAVQNLIYKKDKTPDEQKFSDEIERAKKAAREEKLEGAQWTLACTPGLGYMSHAGWECASCPTVEKQSLFYATRTLGLTRGGKACFARVPLDFSALGLITLEKATVLLEAVDKNASQERPQADPMTDIEPAAREIIVQFSQDLAAACLEIHTKLQDKC